MFNSKAANINQLWANMIVEELLRHGVDHFVLSPGSRCTPLTVAAVGHEKTNVISHLDERGAAFYALGYARATGKPAVLICTSGTATANYYPAIIEASMDTIPMIVLTGDRPVELRGTGANQTIDQVEMYGKYVRFFHDLPAPDSQHKPETVLKVINDAISGTLASPKGPVHINCQFREPLAPLGENEDFNDYLSGVKSWVDGSSPMIIQEQPNGTIVSEKIKSVVSILGKAQAGLLVVGALQAERDRRAVSDLAEKLNWPIFADIRSGLRLGNNLVNVIDAFDQLLLSDKFCDMKIDTVLHLGSVMTSKRYNTFAQNSGFKHYIHVADHPFGHDPNNAITYRIECSIADFCDGAIQTHDDKPNEKVLNEYVQANHTAVELIDKFVDDNSHVDEPSVANLVPKHIADGTGLFLGSSMPVRDMDMYANSSGSRVPVVANRGASGIDGSIATAVGFASGLNSPITAVIGDLALLHDLSSLTLLAKGPHPVTLVVINNNGGGIFSFLPIHECKEVFEDYFATPHGLSFEQIAGAFALDYSKPESKDDFVKIYKKAQGSRKSSIIEIVTDREENLAAHTALQDKIKSAIENL